MGWDMKTKPVLNQIDAFCEGVLMSCNGRVKEIYLDKAAFRSLEEYLSRQLPIFSEDRLKDLGSGKISIYAAGYKVAVLLRAG